MNDEQRSRIDEMIAIHTALAEPCDTNRQQLVLRLDKLVGDEMIALFERVLRHAGAVLLEHDRADLFEEIYARAHEGDLIRPGDGRRFLFREVGQ